mmetsp:Transcript_17142/g.24235  ORF Transcript_17142/g.24235 Transcript_17142/m.24235 type:complete len:400 (-) Transcript_17142:343-1542(-)
MTVLTSNSIDSSSNLVEHPLSTNLHYSSTLVNIPTIKNNENRDQNNQESNQRMTQYSNLPLASSIFSYIIRALLIPITDQSGHSVSSNLTGLISLFVVGSIFGFILPTDPSLPDRISNAWKLTSNAVGYTYALCWSVSFYPQILTNYRRKSTSGLSTDFSVLNVLGFACYAAYTVSFFCDIGGVKDEYKERHGANAIVSVTGNDVAFAVHAFIISSFQVWQIYSYRIKTFGGSDGKSTKKNRSVTSMSTTEHLSMAALVFVVGSILLCTIYGLYIQSASRNKEGSLLWPLDFIYALSSVKLAVSIVKYIPQAYLNFRRKSTLGWNIWNIILDFTGGILSLLQLVGDCAAIGNFSGITGNWVKFGLGFISIFFDIIFLLQHYVLYPHNGQIQNAEEEPFV